MALAKQQRDVDGEPTVHRVFLGGRQDWNRIESSLIAQLIEAGVSNSQVNRIVSQLENAYLRWRPETVLLISEDDRDVVLPFVEDMEHRERVTVNGLMFEILKREIRALPAGEGRR